MKKRILTHPELYEESLRLEDLVEKYKTTKDYKKMEKILLELSIVYDRLNYCDEDEYLEDLIKTYVKLSEIYITNNDDKKLVKTYEKIIENYDYIIQRDKKEEDLLNKHVKELQEICLLYKRLNSCKDIIKEYPRLKKYIGE